MNLKSSAILLSLHSIQLYLFLKPCLKCFGNFLCLPFLGLLSVKRSEAIKMGNELEIFSNSLKSTIDTITPVSIAPLKDILEIFCAFIFWILHSVEKSKARKRGEDNWVMLEHVFRQWTRNFQQFFKVHNWYNYTCFYSLA